MRQYNGQKDKRKNKDLQNTTQKTVWLAVPVPLVTPIVVRYHISGESRVWQVGHVPLGATWRRRHWEVFY